MDINFNNKYNKLEQYYIREQYANEFLKQYNLKPNFNIINFINQLGIETVPLSKIPEEVEFNDYFFYHETKENIIKLFYLDELINYKGLETEEYLKIKNNQRYHLAFALAEFIFHYTFNEKNKIKSTYNGMTVFKCYDNWGYIYDFQRRDCTFFADCLLIPEAIFKQKLYEIINSKYITKEQYESLANYFGVPSRQIIRRAKCLSLIH